jgi:hypothetical protein
MAVSTRVCRSLGGIFTVALLFLVQVVVYVGTKPQRSAVTAGWLARYDSQQVVVESKNDPNVRKAGSLDLDGQEDEGTREVAYITYAHLKDTKRFENHIFPSMDTWFRGDEPYFVVLGNQWMEAYHHGLCKNDSAYFKPYCERMVPIFVNCPEGYYGESPCCKNEKGILHMLDEHGDRYGWFMYMDDDMYIRREYLTRYLEPLYPSDTMVLASGKNGGRLTKLGSPSFQFGNAKYNCSSDIEYMYPWGQPIIYSHGALAGTSGCGLSSWWACEAMPRIRSDA